MTAAALEDPLNDGSTATWAGSPVSRAAAPPLRLDPSLLSELQRSGRFDPTCLNCGGCSVVCDLTYGDVTFPRRPIRRVVIGAREAVLEGLEPWLCHDCGDCTIACPRQADPAESMRTLRRWLTGQYDPTGIAARVLGSRRAHLTALLAVGLLVLALAAFYHARYVGLGLSDLKTPMGLSHMFGKIVWFTWAVYALPALFLLLHVGRMFHVTMRRERPAFRHFASQLATLVVETVTQEKLRKCSAHADAAHRAASAAGTELGAHRWLKHWLMALGCTVFFVLTAFFLRWFQTDAVHPIWHPQRWIGYLATFFILWATTEIILRRRSQLRRDPATAHRGLMLPGLLWLTCASGLAVHVFRLAGLGLACHLTYALHLAILVPMIVVEVPFGEWAHMIDRPLALYFQAVRERARAEGPVRADLAPETA